MNGQRLWRNAWNPSSILPLEYKRGLGRPRKLRRRKLGEDLNPTKLRRKKTKYQCKRCGKPSHNQRKFNFPPPVVKQPKNEGTIIQPVNEGNVEGDNFVESIVVVNDNAIVVI